jgi:heptosyltransferase-3
VKRVLLVQLRQLGDILLTTPVIREIKNHWPDAELTFLSGPLGRLVLKDNPLLSRHLVLEEGSLIEDLRLLRVLQKAKFDSVIDFMGNPRSAIVTMLTNARQSIGFNSSRRLFYNEVVTRDSGDDYIVAEKFRMLKPLGLAPSQDYRLMFEWGEAHSHQVLQFLGRLEGPAKKRRVVLSPTHKRIARRWDEASWVHLSDWLTSKMDSQVIWVWGPGEEDEVKRLQSKTRFKSSVAPKTNLQELAALVAQCDYFVSGSNGPSHFAVAVNTPSLQLHGPTDSPSWSPKSHRHRVIQSENRVMSGISVGQVCQSLEAMFAELDQDPAQRRVILTSEDVWKVRPQL